MGFHRIIGTNDGSIIAERYEWKHILLICENIWPDYGIVSKDDDTPIIIMATDNGQYQKVAEIVYIDED